MMPEKLVLLVEDNPDDEELSRLALKHCNMINRIFVARDGVEALEFLKNAGKSKSEDDIGLPELILLDLKLPKINGLEVLEKIRGNPKTRYIPTVILTSSNEGIDIQNSYLKGANSYVRKPVSFEEFREMMKLLCTYWLGLNRTPASSLKD
jgi:two-component system response regulator